MLRRKPIRFTALVGIALLPALIGGCVANSMPTQEATPTSMRSTATGSEPPGTSPVLSGEATPEFADVIVRGLVLKNEKKCLSDGACLMSVLDGDTEYSIIYGTGEPDPCRNQKAMDQGLRINEGDHVEILGARAILGEAVFILTCGKESYYIKRVE